MSTTYSNAESIALLEAAKKGDVKRVNEALQKKADIEIVDKVSDFPPIHS